MPIKSQLMVFQCPSCNATLVAGTQICQFCGKPTGQIGQAIIQDMRAQQGPSRSWQEISYWVLTWIWVASGVFGLVQALGMSPQMGGYFGPLSVLHLLIGLGLLTQNDWAIWIAKMVTYLTIVGAFIGILLSFLLKSPLAVAISLAYYVGEFALACFQIYIFGYMSD